MQANKIHKVIAGSPDKLLKIGDTEMEVYVLEGGQRVIHTRGLQRALNLPDDTGRRLEFLLTKSSIKPFVDQEIFVEISNPIKFKKPLGDKTNRTIEANGYDATILKKICDTVLRARHESTKEFSDVENKVARQAEILLSGFAEIGITALVDEVTGYQKQKDEYQKLLSEYIANEIRPWVKTFDDNYYKQLYRLLGWDWDSFKNQKRNHSQYIGKLTNRIVYEKIAPGIIEELNKINPKNEHGNRISRHHQRLSENTGYIHLVKHISAITTIMEDFPNGDWVDALYKIDTRFPSVRLSLVQERLNFDVETDKESFNNAIDKAIQS